MVDYEAIYRVLFDGITDAIEDIDRQNYGYAREILLRTKQVAEEIFMTSGDSRPIPRLTASGNEGTTSFRRMNR